jgi:hypothetical protein
MCFYFAPVVLAVGEDIEDAAGGFELIYECLCCDYILKDDEEAVDEVFPSFGGGVGQVNFFLHFGLHLFRVD